MKEKGRFSAGLNDQFKQSFLLLSWEKKKDIKADPCVIPVLPTTNKLSQEIILDCNAAFNKKLRYLASLVTYLSFIYKNMQYSLPTTVPLENGTIIPEFLSIQIFMGREDRKSRVHTMSLVF